MLGFLSLLISCSNNDVPIDCSVSDLTLNLVSTVPATGCGVGDGTISISAQGGTGGYEYKIQNGIFQSSGEFVDLTPGIYSFVVRDKDKCETTLDNIVLMATDISFSADVIENTNCVGGNGSITISIGGGQPPYQYKLGDDAFGTNNVFTELDAGNYLITVKDNNECISELNINVSQGITHTSWSSEILPIIENSCALNGCHDGGNINHSDLRIYSNAKFYATLIKTYTQDGSMPFEGEPLEQYEIDRIACWVDEGALNN